MTIDKLSKLMTDDAILAELGFRMARCRIDRQLTQAALAHQAGVSKRTVERIEAGASAQMVSVIRICRVLDLVAGIDQWIPQPDPRPMDLVARKGRTRQRASSSRKTQGADEPWTWDP
ncbi:transcriptional regulator [Desulfosarcina ovata subsp. sediminis]|uniref:Transcriptional regulator n=1 Tax=Desulfosarcina ovata subsp. sediminis TaxID=885957 RepID=A0A5K8A052_9BACT|nr:helix-turn-helix domain-containing protein [Desulfosarcina ovata]BBO85796.1 transcriptional regulator [Desulfosarcina ovata subsp. sediminis]